MQQYAVRVAMSDEIINKARRLKEIEHDYKKMYFSRTWPREQQELEVYFDKVVQHCLEAFQLYKELACELSNTNNVPIQDASVRKQLREIKNINEYYSIKFIKSLLEAQHKDILDENIMVDNHTDALLEFTNNYDHVNYCYSKIIIGSIITTTSINKSIASYFSEIRETYALRLYRSCVGLCRALLEMALYEKIQNLPEMRNQSVVNIQNARQDHISNYIELALRYKIIRNRNLNDKAHAVRKFANSVLHVKGTAVLLAQEKVLLCVRDVVEVVESIYG